MTIPDFQTIMLPLLKFAGDGKEHTLHEAEEKLAKVFNLSEEEQGQRAKKGIFITTSDFTKEATDFAAKIESKIVLIDGQQLAQYMIDHNIGVTPVTNYEIKRIDSDYFNEE